MSGACEVQLRVQDGIVRFGDLHVLGPMSFEVRSGECVVLLGPSGCGKSTLLAALAGLQELTSGVAEVTDKSQQPSFVFQDPNLLGWLSAQDNVALPLDIAGTPGEEQKSRALAALDLVGLASFSKARPRALSGGMAMRVALARALVSKPKALLLDEPFGAIDELGRRDLNDLVHTSRRRDGVAILFVTHSVEEAVYMADRIVVMSPRPGRIVEIVDVPDVARNPDFVLSDVFAQTVQRARRALAQQVAA